MRWRAVVLGAWLLAACEDHPPCGELGETECEADNECMWTTVTRYRMNDGACEVVASAASCEERVMVTAGCSGFSCGDGGFSAPWYRLEPDGSALIAEPDLCGAGVEGWQQCTQKEQEAEPPICGCVCE
jgi:hypothetical protein